MRWILVLFLYQGQGLATAVVPGFTSAADCQSAGAQAHAGSPTFVPTKFVCIQQKA